MNFLDLSLNYINKTAEPTKKKTTASDPWEVVKISGKEYLINAMDDAIVPIEKEASLSEEPIETLKYNTVTVKVSCDNIFKSNNVISHLTAEGFIEKNAAFLNILDNSVVFDCQVTDKTAAKNLLISKCAEVVPELTEDNVILFDKVEEPKPDVEVAVYSLPKVSDTINDVILNMSEHPVSDNGKNFVFEGTPEEYGTFSMDLNKALTEKQRNLDDSLSSEDVKNIVDKYFTDGIVLETSEADIPEGSTDDSAFVMMRPQTNYEQFTNNTEMADPNVPTQNTPNKLLNANVYSGKTFWKEAELNSYILVLNNDIKNYKSSNQLDLLQKYAEFNKKPFVIINASSKEIVADSVYQSDDKSQVKKPEELGVTPQSDVKPVTLDVGGQHFTKKELTDA